jgi:hypothetical protein
MSGSDFSSAAQRWAIIEEVGGAHCCLHPVRLAGTSANATTGEITSGEVTVACKDRRASVCPSCSALYRADAWQLVAAGLRGGKGVPESVTGHPRLFVTLTAPGFGPVHRGSRPGAPPVPCRPRRQLELCPHGMRTACFERHEAGDECLGQPLCATCFDYEAAVLWNAHAPRLWRRSVIGLSRSLCRVAGIPSRKARQHFRLSFVKVIEFQRRGLAHFHVVVRADGPDGPTSAPPAWLDADALAQGVREVAFNISVPSAADPGVRYHWGTQVDVQDLGSAEDAEAAAAYTAKYATKCADDEGSLARPLRSRRAIASLSIDEHRRRLVEVAWSLGLGPTYRPLRLRAHAHTFGYPGHFATKSTRYSTTFAALRAARAAFMRDEGYEAIPVDGGWRYRGRGYRHADAQRLAEAFVEARSGLDREFPRA